MKGKKFDEGKPAVHLLPSEALFEVAEVLGFGSGKYGAYNWALGMDWSRLHAAALRHILKWNAGESIDEESGKNHIAHAACCLLMLLEYQKRNIGKDDRHQWKNEKS